MGALVALWPFSRAEGTDLITEQHLQGPGQLQGEERLQPHPLGWGNRREEEGVSCTDGTKSQKVLECGINALVNEELSH